MWASGSSGELIDVSSTGQQKAQAPSSDPPPNPDPPPSPSRPGPPIPPPPPPPGVMPLVPASGGLPHLGRSLNRTIGVVGAVGGPSGGSYSGGFRSPGFANMWAT